MDGKQRKYNGQVEINDLIGDAVNNALFRRHQSRDSQDALSALSNEEVAKIAGGQQSIIKIDPTTMGYSPNKGLSEL